LTRTIDFIAEAVARRVGRDPGDFATRNFAGAVVGVILAANMPWEQLAKEGGAHMSERIDAALAHLEAGLPL
jgi:hypothetical protein